MKKYKKIYEQKGVVVIPGVFTSEECDEIKKQAYLTKDLSIKEAGYPHIPSETIYNKKSIIFFPCLANSFLNEIRTSEKITNLVKEFIGDDVRQINNQIYFRERGDLDEFAWHQDIIFREHKNFNEFIEEDYFQTIIAVDDITEDNGAIEFIEGSHRNGYIERPENLRKFVRGNRIGKKYIAKKGDVIIWSVMIVHGSEKNNSNSDRMTYMNGFCKTRSCKSYPDFLINGKIKKFMDVNSIP
jgi:ectoine hydroxylase-related dioxygenase (phytanoyl-CoA dioxygenase family)